MILSGVIILPNIKQQSLKHPHKKGTFLNKYIVIILCMMNALNSMENQPLITPKPQREPREWPAQAYDEGNTLQTNAFIYFLQTNNIKTANRTIIDAGCGTGK